MTGCYKAHIRQEDPLPERDDWTARPLSQQINSAYTQSPCEVGSLIVVLNCYHGIFKFCQCRADGLASTTVRTSSFMAF
jgi:hypothetical protein